MSAEGEGVPNLSPVLQVQVVERGFNQRTLGLVVMVVVDGSGEDSLRGKQARARRKSRPSSE